MAQVSVCFARFPGDHKEHPDVTDWFTRSILQAKADPRIGRVTHFRITDTPITMGRNRCLEICFEQQIDICYMVDNDMKPDMYVGGEESAVPFFPVSFNFLWKHAGPAMIAAPYAGPPPHENIYVFKWANFQSDHHDSDFHLDQFSRSEMTPDKAKGIERVGALATGLCAFSVEGVKKLKPPYFYYEYKTSAESEKASTEDVTFSRDLSMVGTPIYVLWDSWAGHWKWKCVGRPHSIDVDDVRASLRNAVIKEYEEKHGLPACNCEYCLSWQEDRIREGKAKKPAARIDISEEFYDRAKFGEIPTVSGEVER